MDAQNASKLVPQGQAYSEHEGAEVPLYWGRDDLRGDSSMGDDGGTSDLYDRFLISALQRAIAKREPAFTARMNGGTLMA